jgi:signal transduction histidine kinase
MEIVTLNWLKSLEVFIDVPDEQLQWFIDHSENQLLTDGEFILEPGQPITGPHIIVTGGMNFYMMQHGARREYTTFHRGEVTGYLPYSRGKHAAGYARAVGALQLLSLPTELVPEMIKTQFELTQALVHVMSNRVKNFTAMQQQNEKMMALGKLSAGLAHELNNPASAIVRDALSLKEHLRLEPNLIKDMAEVNIGVAQVDRLNEELSKILAVTDHVHLTLKQRMALEDEITDWFDSHGVGNGYAIAESFADFNFTAAQLDAFAEGIPAESLTTAFSWISNLLVTDRMVQDILQSSKRIADLVSSIKNFTHMDRAQDKQYADIRLGIGNTLTMLGYKIRKGNIQIVEEYDETLPPVKGLIGELNQVWTNLIDNAIDAMEPNQKGTLTLKTAKDGEFVKVSVIDDGPGISSDVISRVFDPFFTTKAMGKGTGMGLEVVQGIIQQHNGSVKVNSEPGHTEFIVCFPLNN